MDTRVILLEALAKFVQTLAQSDAEQPTVAVLQLIVILYIYVHKCDNVLHQDRETWQNSH